VRVALALTSLCPRIVLRVSDSRVLEVLYLMRLSQLNLQKEKLCDRLCVSILAFTQDE